MLKHLHIVCTYIPYVQRKPTLTVGFLHAAFERGHLVSAIVTHPKIVLELVRDRYIISTRARAACTFPKKFFFSELIHTHTTFIQTI